MCMVRTLTHSLFLSLVLLRFFVGNRMRGMSIFELLIVTVRIYIHVWIQPLVELGAKNKIANEILKRLTELKGYFMSFCLNLVKLKDWFVDINRLRDLKIDQLRTFLKIYWINYSWFFQLFFGSNYLRKNSILIQWP